MATSAPARNPFWLLAGVLVSLLMIGSGLLLLGRDLDLGAFLPGASAGPGAPFSSDELPQALRENISSYLSGAIPPAFAYDASGASIRAPLLREPLHDVIAQGTLLGAYQRTGLGQKAGDYYLFIGIVRGDESPGSSARFVVPIWLGTARDTTRAVDTTGTTAPPAGVEWAPPASAAASDLTAQLEAGGHLTAVSTVVEVTQHLWGGYALVAIRLWQDRDSFSPDTGGTAQQAAEQARNTYLREQYSDQRVAVIKQFVGATTEPRNGASLQAFLTRYPLLSAFHLDDSGRVVPITIDPRASLFASSVT